MLWKNICTLAAQHWNCRQTQQAQHIQKNIADGPIKFKSAGYYSTVTSAIKNLSEPLERKRKRLCCADGASNTKYYKEKKKLFRLQLL